MNSEDEIDLAKLADEESVEVAVGFPDYGLTENPFPTSAIAMKTRLFFNLGNKFRKSIFEDIGRRIVHTARAGRYRGMVILGDFGLGKTHTLYYFSEQINKQLGDKKDVKSRAVYIGSPGTSLYDLLQNFVKEVGFDFIIDSIYVGNRKAILEQVAKYLSEKTKTAIAATQQPYQPAYYQQPQADNKERIDKLKSILRNCEELSGTDCDLDNVQKTIKEVLLATGYYYFQHDNTLARFVSKALLQEKVFTLEDYAYCLSILMFSTAIESRRAAVSYLLGDRLLANEVRMLGLASPQISTTDISKRVFPDILRILHEFGEQYNMIFVFVDEFEKIVLGLKGTKRFEFLEDLRNLIDYNLNQFSLVLGCSTEAFETIRATSPAFADRNRDVIDLPRISTIDEVKSLILAYINEKRIQNFNGPATYPFEEKALSMLVENEHGSPRYILEACHKLLNYGLKKNSKSIDEDLIKNWYGK